MLANRNILKYLALASIPVYYYACYFASDFNLYNDLRAAYAFVKHATFNELYTLVYSYKEPGINIYLLSGYLSFNPVTYILIIFCKTFVVPLGELSFISSIIAWQMLLVIIGCRVIKVIKIKYAFLIATILLILSDNQLIRQYNFDFSINLPFLLYLSLIYQFLVTRNVNFFVYNSLLISPIIFFGHVFYSSIFLFYAVLFSSALALIVSNQNLFLIKLRCLFRLPILLSVLTLVAIVYLISCDIELINNGIINLVHRDLNVKNPFYGSFAGLSKFLSFVLPSSWASIDRFVNLDVTLFVGPYAIGFLLVIYAAFCKSNKFSIVLVAIIIYLVIVTTENIVSKSIYSFLPGLGILRHAGYYSSLIKVPIILGLVLVAAYTPSNTNRIVWPFYALCIAIGVKYEMLSNLQVIAILLVILVMYAYNLKKYIYFIAAPIFIHTLISLSVNYNDKNLLRNYAYSFELNFNPISNYRVDTTLIGIDSFYNTDYILGATDHTFKIRTIRDCDNYNSKKIYCEKQIDSVLLDISNVVIRNCRIIISFFTLTILWFGSILYGFRGFKK